MKLNQSGQFTMEAVLLMAAMMSIALFIGREMRDRKLASTLVEGPWKPVQGMIEDGVWANPRVSKSKHPSIKARHATAQGTAPPGG